MSGENTMPRMMTVAELAERWRLSKARIYEMVRARQIRSVRLTGTKRRVVRFRLDDVESFERRHEG